MTSVKLWPPYNHGGSRATPGTSLVKIGAGVSEIWWWPWLNPPANWLNSPANFKILPPSDLWPWMTLTRPPYNHRGSRAISGAILVKIGAGVLEWLRNIHTYIRRHIPWIIVWWLYIARCMITKIHLLLTMLTTVDSNMWSLWKNNPLVIHGR